MNIDFLDPKVLAILGLVVVIVVVIFWISLSKDVHFLFNPEMIGSGGDFSPVGSPFFLFVTALLTAVLLFWAPNFHLFEHDPSSNPNPDPDILTTHYNTADGNKVLNIPDKVNPQSKGIIANDLPDSMEVGETYLVEVNIAKLTERLTLIPTATQEGFNMPDTIPVSDIMKVNVLPLKIGDFSISPISESIQLVDIHSRTRWLYSITPEKGGDNTLVIVANARIQTSSGEKSKDIEVYKKEVVVKSNWPYQAMKLISSNWQWVGTVLLIPIFLWGRRKALDWWEERKKPKGKSAGFR